MGYKSSEFRRYIWAGNMYVFGVVRVRTLFNVRKLSEIIKKVSMDTEEKTKD